MISQVELEQDILDGARSSMTYDFASKSETVGAAVSLPVFCIILWPDAHGSGRNCIPQRSPEMRRQGPLSAFARHPTSLFF